MCSEEMKNGQTASKIDDGNGNREKFDDVETDRWFLRWPSGEQPDKCSLSLLKKWSERSPYASKFKVWRDDGNEENAIWLLEAISIAFPAKSKENVDFTDMQTVEGYHNIKKEEGFDSTDLYAAVEREKFRKEYQSASGLEEDEEEEEDKEYKISVDDGTDDKSKYKKLRSENSSKRMKSAKKSIRKERIHHGNDSKLEHHNITSADQPKETRMKAEESEENETNNGQRASTRNLNESGKFDDVESDRWCIKGPYGEQPENCSLSLLKLWSERSSYAFRFKVWRDDENEANAISLKEAIIIAFPEKSKEDMRKSAPFLEIVLKPQIRP